MGVFRTYIKIRNVLVLKYLILFFIHEIKKLEDNHEIEILKRIRFT